MLINLGIITYKSASHKHYQLKQDHASLLRTYCKLQTYYNRVRTYTQHYFFNNVA